MPDTRNMTPEQYATFTGKMSYPAGHAEQVQERAPESSRSEFTPGQTVWCKKTGRLARQVVATNRDRVWIATEHTSFLAPSADFTATDPSAKTEPLQCPFCRQSIQEPV